jgi:hypothetical protein
MHFIYPLPELHEKIQIAHGQNGFNNAEESAHQPNKSELALKNH